MTAAAPPERQLGEHIYYSMTKGLCGTCKRAVDAKIHFKGGQVYFDKFCPEHGHQECHVSSSVEWYLDALSFVAPHDPPSRVEKKVEKGCPFDCGPCESHQQKVYLPVIPITSACNLDCPICYTINKNEDPHQTTKEELQQILDHLVRDHEELDIINFTGGEPTLHPELPAFLEQCREAGIERLTISTNGLRLAKDDEFLAKMAALDARIVLSLDTFDPETDLTLLGANTVKTKLKVLDRLEEKDVSVTILPAVAAGLNDKDVPALFDLVMSRKNILSLEMHTMCFTGQGGVGFERSGRISIPDLHRILEEHTGGKIAWTDFVPSPLAHPHCYSICYLLCLDDGGYVPFTRLTSRQTLFELLQDSLYIEPRAKLEEVFRGIIDDLWANPDKIPESDAVLTTIKGLLRRLYPPGGQLTLTERRKISERSVKAVYIHSHMDEENFDVARIMKCCVGVPETDGTNIPTCSYNVLYREQDERFADSEMLQRMTQTRPDHSRPLPLAKE